LPTVPSPTTTDLISSMMLEDFVLGGGEGG
jgi:hypothetical protein